MGRESVEGSQSSTQSAEHQTDCAVHKVKILKYLIVEQDVLEDIINWIPYYGKSTRIIQMDNRWVDHKTFGCAMQVYGRVNRYVIDILSKAVMVEQFELDKIVVLQLNYFSRHIVKCDIAKYYQDPYLNPSEISSLFTEPNQGYKLDVMDMDDAKALREILTYYSLRFKMFDTVDFLFKT
uniref:Uncharacterized protein n=1 Tax=Oryza meridionalis TaxID=40149 RepID=A0A0E0FBV6_9ORYZ